MNFLVAVRVMGILFFTFFVVVLDQITKLIVKSRFYIRESIEIFGDLVRFTYIENEGMAFGIRVGNKLFLTIFTTLASIIILVYMYRMRNERFLSRLALSLILGGAIGNLIDRFAYGAVIDFIDIGVGSTRWPVFNVADSGVTIGMIILISVVLFDKDKSETTSTAPAFPLKEPAPSDEKDNWRDARRPS